MISWTLFCYHLSQHFGNPTKIFCLLNYTLNTWFLFLFFFIFHYFHFLLSFWRTCEFRVHLHWKKYVDIPGFAANDICHYFGQIVYANWWYFRNGFFHIVEKICQIRILIVKLVFSETDITLNLFFNLRLAFNAACST